MSMKPMLACNGNLAKISYPVVIHPKFDGIRACVVNGKLVSRTLKPIPNAEIRAALERPEFEGLDGELVVGDPTAKDAYNRSVSFVMAESKTGEPWTYHVFDKWDHPGPFRERAAWLSACIAFRALNNFQVVRGHSAVTLAALEALEQAHVEEGWEGVIVRDPEAVYKFGRSGVTGPLLKVKRFTDFEAEVIGVYELMHNANEAVTNALGRTERSSHAAGKVGKGTLGGLILRALNGPWEGVEFRCGTGFNAVEREVLWERAVVGQFAKIKAFEIGAKDAPRFPVFLGWRDASDFDQ